MNYQEKRKPTRGRAAPPGSFDRPLPRNLDAEGALLGSVILDNLALGIATGIVRSEDFFAEANRLIFDHMIRLSQKGRGIDAVTICEELKNAALLETVGGPVYICGLSDGVPVGDHLFVQNYARIVKEKSTLRRLISVGVSVASRALDASEDPQMLIQDAHRQINEIAVNAGDSRHFWSLRNIIDEYDGHIERIFESASALKGAATGLTDLDKVLCGLQPAELIVVAADPGNGKTALLLDATSNSAIRPLTYSVRDHEPIPAGIFSLEMSRKALLARLTCSLASIDSHRLRSGLAGRSDWKALTSTMGLLAESPVYIDDTPAIPIEALCSRARSLYHEKHIGLLGVDFIQLVGSPGETRAIQVGHTARALKSLAKELNIPIIALSQLSRPEEKGRRRRPPTMRDLRESGEIEQAADVVVFIHEPQNADDEGDSEVKKMQLIVDKQRNGPTGPVSALFMKRFVRFENAVPKKNLKI